VFFLKKKCHRKAAHNFLNKIYSEKTSLIKTIQSIESSLEGTANKQFLELALVSNNPIQPANPFKASLVAKELKKTLEINIAPGQLNLVRNQSVKLRSNNKSLRIKT